jgi:diguanylate cyclase (GGDEF)-like protein/PAS domain S-box-containing protein
MSQQEIYTKVLLIEQNADDARSIQNVLSQIADMNLQVITASECGSAANLLAQNNTDIVFLDLTHENGKALDVLASVMGRVPRVPCIVLMEEGDAAGSAAAIQTGASDCFSKSDLTGHALARAIKYAISVNTVKTLQEKLESQQKTLEEVLETERKEMLQIRQSVEYEAGHYIRHLFEAVVDPFVTVSSEGKILDVNRASEELFGVPRDQLIGTMGHLLFTDPQHFLDGIKLILDQGFVRDYRLSVKHSSGRMIDVSYNADVYRNSQGKIEGIITSGRDITEQLRQDAELARLAVIVENSQDAIVSTTLDGIVLTWNKGAEVTYGYSKQEMIGQLISRHFPSDYCNDVLDKLASIDHFETECERKDGKRIYVSIQLSPIRDASGKITAVSRISRDISESKRLAKRLQESESRFRGICSGALDGIICIDQEGKATVFNYAAEKMLGCKSEEIIGNELQGVLVPTRYQSLYREGLEKFRASGDAPIFGKTFELMATKGDGSEVPIELSISSVRIDDSWQAIGVIRDITERKKIDQKLQQNEQALRDEHNRMTQTNERLSLQSAEMERHAVQMELLTQMEEYLQICSSEEEAQSMIAKFGEALSPQSCGAVYRFQDSKDWLATAGHWGEHMVDQGPFVHSDCWALRRGQPHSFSKTAPGPRCAHVPEAATSSLCVPLVLLGEVLGLVNINWHENQSLLEDERLVIRMTGVAALALGNLRLRKQLLELSIRDPLTGLFNRRYMEEFFVRELIKARRDKSSLSVFMLDIDHFKQFNDTFGHEAGDAVLRDFGIFLRSRLRESDISCRYGGEEFIVLLPNCSSDIAYQRANDLRNAVKQMQVHCGDQILPVINVSIGLATFPLVGANLEDLVRAADAALYQAKEQGRDRVCTASECTETAKCKDN